MPEMPGLIERREVLQILLYDRTERKKGTPSVSVAAQRLLAHAEQQHLSLKIEPDAKHLEAPFCRPCGTVQPPALQLFFENCVAILSEVSQGQSSTDAPAGLNSRVAFFLTTVALAAAISRSCCKRCSPVLRRRFRPRSAERTWASASRL